MERRPTQNRLQLLSQALSAAASSINLARQLINEIQREGGALESPGLIGKYDGMFMVTEAGKKYPVPDNYAAKTRLVYGDKLKMVEGREGRRFRHIEKIPRIEAEATLTVKDGRFVAVSSEGSYKLIQSAVRYLKGEEGNKVKIILPREEKHAPFAAILEVMGKKARKEKVEKPPQKRGPAEVEKEEKVEKPKKEEKKAPAKKEEEKKAKPVAKKVVKKEEKKKKLSEAKSAPARPAGGSGGKAEPKKTAAKAKSAPGGKAPAKKGEAVIAPPGEEELR